MLSPWPWRWLLRRLALRHGFLDPLHVLDRLRRFAQPSEVGEPLELLRAGAAFHARGLLNTRAIQYNMDWVWPFWAERQFNPRDPSFIPRGFSITHINLTHRNWTAVGLPDSPTLSLVDPAGLVTPFFDGWSLDAVVLGDNPGEDLFPSRLPAGDQVLLVRPGLSLATRHEKGFLSLTRRAQVQRALDEKGNARDTLVLEVGASCKVGEARLALTLRPYNPEGMALIDAIETMPDGLGWRVDQKQEIRFSTPPLQYLYSDHARGDVLNRLRLSEIGPDEKGVICKVGLATAAALYPIRLGSETVVRLEILLDKEPRPLPRRTHWKPPDHENPWRERQGAPELVMADGKATFLYRAALSSMLLHAPWGVVVPGPYTYRRFWFRDAAFILDAMLVMGMVERVRQVLVTFASRQLKSGYFLSQDGEWDSNGEALWILNRFEAYTGEKVPGLDQDAILRGGRWIQKKSLKDAEHPALKGLMPAGFSAEHLGPNDHYYWDAFWSQAGLEASASMLKRRNCLEASEDLLGSAEKMARDIGVNIALAQRNQGTGLAIPASPHRRMDAGAIGSLAMGYPLQLGLPGDKRLLATAEWLLANHFVRGAFFQDMIHSGINPYLTLHLAQVLLRAGDARHWELAKAVADLASPTGQWPEAIHPATLGGCMGDGQHIWAAAEWVRYIRNLFLREEGEDLVLGQGLLPGLRQTDGTLSLGPAPCAFGTLTVALHGHAGDWEASWKADWQSPPKNLLWCVPGTLGLVLPPEPVGRVKLTQG